MHFKHEAVLFITVTLVMPLGWGANPPISCETPSSLGCVYGLTSNASGCQIYGNTVNPQGGHNTIAVVEALDNPNAQSDLNAFSTLFGLSNKSLTVIYAPAAPSDNPLPTACQNLPLPSVTPPSACTNDITASNNPCDEHVADIEWVHAMAQNANIIMVEAKSNNIQDKMYAVCYAAAAVTAQGGGMVSMSWSTNEFAAEKGFDAYFQSFPNVIFVASAGDHAAPALYPSSSPYVISAGGTSILRDAAGNFIGETAWSKSSAKLDVKDGGSGGPSAYESRPSYQDSVMKVVGNARGTPDIAFDSDPKTGVCVYSSLHTPTPGWFRDGGTSIAAPALSGILNVANHHASSTFDELTFIYTSAIKNYHSYWHDILQGNNGFPALSGYDFTTGLGSPLGYGGK